MAFIRLKKRVHIFVFLLIVNIIILNIPALEKTFPNILLYGTHFFRSSIGVVVSGVSNITANLMSSKRLKKENKLLKEQLADYKSHFKSTEALLFENNKLRELLQFKYSVDYEVILSKVINMTQVDGGREFVINAGYKSGVSEGMIVCSIYVDKLVLLGRITKSLYNTSVFESILRSDFTMPIVTDLTEQKGLLIGQGIPSGSLKVMFDSIYRSKYVFVGEEVQIHEYSSMFPQGIPIGRISNIETNNEDLLISANVTPYVLPKNIDVVLVLVPQNKEEIEK